MKQIIKHCEECGEEFTTYIRTQKYCGDKCRNKHTNKRNYVGKPVSAYKYISVWGNNEVYKEERA